MMTWYQKIFLVLRWYKEPEMVIGMISDLTIITGSNDNRIQLVRGCPCMREYGNERVCINNDDVSAIKSISVDPHFFAQLESIEMLSEFESEKEDLCYGLLNLDPRDGIAYCVAQGKAIVINHQAIRAADIKEALNFVLPSQMGVDDAVCSSCLYKYLITLTDVFREILSDNERSSIVLAYTKDLVNLLAAELSQGSVSFQRNSLIARTEKFDQSLLLLSKKHYDRILNLDSPHSEDMELLIDAYRKLGKFESVFQHQVLSLNQDCDEISAVTYLRLMIGTTHKILSLHDELRNLRHVVMSSGLVSEEHEIIVDEIESIRKKSEMGFRKLVPLLSEIERRPTEKVL